MVKEIDFTVKIEKLPTVLSRDCDTFFFSESTDHSTTFSVFLFVSWALKQKVVRPHHRNSGKTSVLECCISLQILNLGGCVLSINIPDPPR